jgi:hypothetical protein
MSTSANGRSKLRGAGGSIQVLMMRAGLSRVSDAGTV